MWRHFSNRLAQSPNVRDVLLKVMNTGLHVGIVTASAVRGGVAERKHPLAAPLDGTGVPMTTASFPRLEDLVK